MVYETDFYTTRRGGYRPSYTSYSVTTPIRVIPSITSSRVYSSYSSYLPSYSSYYYPSYSSYSYSIPYYSYHRSLPSSVYLPSSVPFRYYSRSTPVRVITSPLREYSPPRIFSVNVRPSVIHRELLRIEHKPRARYGWNPVDEYLNSVHAKEFEDDIRQIRTQTSRVSRMVHKEVPRARRAVSCAPFSRYDSSVTTDREFLEHLRGVPRSVDDDVFTMSRYAQPYRNYIGLDRFRETRRFSAPRPLDATKKSSDPNAELKEKQAARANKLASLNEVDEIQLEKMKAKRLDEQKLIEAQLAQEEKERQKREEEEARRIEGARRKAAEEQARLEQEEAAQAAAEKARREAEKKERERKQQQEEEEKARREAEEIAKREAEAQARKAAEEGARREAEEQARKEAEELARLEAEEAALREAEEQAQREAEEQARREAEELARLEAEEAARLEAEERARIEEEERRREAESRAQVLYDETRRLEELEVEAREERASELARQATELVEIAKLEAEALHLHELERAAEELSHPLENSQSTNADSEAFDDLATGIVEEPLTPAAVEDAHADFSDGGHATAEDHTLEPAGEASVATDDEVEPLE